MTIGNPPEVGILFDLGEDLAAVHPGHMQVQQNEIGSGGVRVRTFAAQKGHRLDAVFQMRDAVPDPAIAQSIDGQIGVVGIIFDQKDLNGLPARRIGRRVLAGL